jgi:hypothetical protein
MVGEGVGLVGRNVGAADGLDVGSRVGTPAIGVEPTE